MDKIVLNCWNCYFYPLLMGQRRDEIYKKHKKAIVCNSLCCWDTAKILKSKGTFFAEFWEFQRFNVGESCLCVGGLLQ